MVQENPRRKPMRTQAAGRPAAPAIYYRIYLYSKKLCINQSRESLPYLGMSLQQRGMGFLKCMWEKRPAKCHSVTQGQ